MKNLILATAALALAFAPAVLAHECPDDDESTLMVRPSPIGHECPEDPEDPDGERAHPVLGLLDLGR